MKNLFLWYLPQAALFCLGVWVVIENGSPDSSKHMPILAGLAFAGVYTAAMVVSLDAPSNVRGLPRLSRWLCLALYGIAGAIGILAGAAALSRSGPVEALAALVVVPLALSLFISLPLAFWTRDLGPWLRRRQRSRAPR